MQATSLYQFLELVCGSWRNAIYIVSSNDLDRVANEDYLLVTNRDGRPVLYAVERFETETGIYVDRTECAGVISTHAFACLYHHWILWNMPDSNCDVFKRLSPL